MKIGIACDHAGFTHKENLKNYLKEKGIEVNDYGCYTEESVDYPDFAKKLTLEYNFVELEMVLI